MGRLGLRKLHINMQRPRLYTRSSSEIILAEIARKEMPSSSVMKKERPMRNRGKKHVRFGAFQDGMSAIGLGS